MEEPKTRGTLTRARARVHLHTFRSDGGWRVVSVTSACCLVPNKQASANSRIAMID